MEEIIHRAYARELFDIVMREMTERTTCLDDEYVGLLDSKEYPMWMNDDEDIVEEIMKEGRETYGNDCDDIV